MAKEKENRLISNLEEKDAKGTNIYTFFGGNNVDTDSHLTLKEIKDPY